MKWLEVYKYGTIRDSTRQNYKRMYRLHIAPVLGNFYLKDITHLQIRALIKDLDKKGYSYEVKNKVRIILLDMFNKAMIDDFVRKNPAKGLCLKRNEKKDVRVLTSHERL